MFCTRCGKEVDNNSSFCDGCGNKLDRPAPQPTLKPTLGATSNKVATPVNTGGLDAVDVLYLIAAVVAGSAVLIPYASNILIGSVNIWGMWGFISDIAGSIFDAGAIGVLLVLAALVYVFAGLFAVAVIIDKVKLGIRNNMKIQAALTFGIIGDALYLVFGMVANSAIAHGIVENSALFWIKIIVEIVGLVSMLGKKGN